MPDLETLQADAIAAHQAWSDGLVSYSPGALASGNVPQRGVRSGTVLVEAMQFGRRMGFRYRIRGKIVSEAAVRAALAAQA